MIAERIRQAPLFNRLPSEEIEHLAAALRRIDFPAGSVLFHENRADDCFYILLEGEVEIIKALGSDDERLLGVRPAGTLLGEMALFSRSGQHTAWVRARSRVEVLQITRSEFEDLLSRRPELAYELIKIITARLEESENATIVDLRSKNRQLSEAYAGLQAAQAQIVEKEKLERELEIARQIQLSFLPQELPSHPRLDLGALMIPARAVGGDFYDFFWLDEERLGIVVGDVSDKGVPAALFMALTFSLVRAEAFRTASPGDVLRSVNRQLLETNAAGMFVTVWYGVLDCRSGELSSARAGHPHPIVLDAAGAGLPPSRGTGQMLGVFNDACIDEHTLVLPAAGLLAVFTDALFETSDRLGDEFSLERLEAVLSAAGGLSAQAVCEQLWAAIQGYSAGLAQQDDFTVVVIRFGNE